MAHTCGRGPRSAAILSSSLDIVGVVSTCRSWCYIIHDVLVSMLEIVKLFLSIGTREKHGLLRKSPTSVVPYGIIVSYISNFENWFNPSVRSGYGLSNLTAGWPHGWHPLAPSSSAWLYCVAGGGWGSVGPNCGRCSRNAATGWCLAKFRYIWSFASYVI